MTMRVGEDNKQNLSYNTSFYNKENVLNFNFQAAEQKRIVLLPNCVASLSAALQRSNENLQLCHKSVQQTLKYIFALLFTLDGRKERKRFTKRRSNFISHKEREINFIGERKRKLFGMNTNNSKLLRGTTKNHLLNL